MEDVLVELGFRGIGLLAGIVVNDQRKTTTKRGLNYVSINF